ncbi:hypothetical protein BC828DRAFT_406158 [Blastocladiella britannica]|nr:hypothetical protein BC828DRAFT_406158 [Blastocladiella britannica]
MTTVGTQCNPLLAALLPIGYFRPVAKNCCYWSGIGCNAEDGTVGSIGLPASGLAGAIPDLSALSRLRSLDLSSNLLNGTIPTFESLTGLKQLVLNDNLLTGPVPNLDHLSQLAVLRLENNALSGSIAAVPHPSDECKLFPQRAQSLCIDSAIQLAQWYWWQC